MGKVGETKTKMMVSGFLMEIILSLVQTFSNSIAGFCLLWLVVAFVFVLVYVYCYTSPSSKTESDAIPRNLSVLEQRYAACL